MGCGDPLGRAPIPSCLRSTQSCSRKRPTRARARVIGNEVGYGSFKSIADGILSYLSEQRTNLVPTLRSSSLFGAKELPMDLLRHLLSFDGRGPGHAAQSCTRESGPPSRSSARKPVGAYGLGNLWQCIAAVRGPVASHVWMPPKACVCGT